MSRLAVKTACLGWLAVSALLVQQTAVLMGHSLLFSVGQVNWYTGSRKTCSLFTQEQVQIVKNTRQGKLARVPLSLIRSCSSLKRPISWPVDINCRTKITPRIQYDENLCKIDPKNVCKTELSLMEAM